MVQSRKRAHGRSSGRHGRSTAWREADWYLGMVGRHGHVYHRLLALPALLDGLRGEGQEVLDIGCGPGVPAPHLYRLGFHYVGVDASGQMIRQAQEWHRRSGIFIQGDARQLVQVVQKRQFDAAFFLFSVQDMQPLEDVLRQAAACLRLGGALVLVLTHPCFRVPRASGWGWDEGRKLHYRRIDRYLTPLPVFNRASATTTFHRPLEHYFAALAGAGLVVEGLRELAPTPELLRQIGRTGQAGNADIPALLVLKARKA